MRRRLFAKTRFSTAALLVVLALQLIVGLQLQAATPAADHHAAAADECPNHPAHRGDHQQAPLGSHDCCHASACQCHCVNAPAAMGLPSLVDVVTSDSIPSFAGAQWVAPRIDEFLRPPIV